MQRKFFGILASVALAVGITGCGSSPAPSNGAAPAKDSKPADQSSTTAAKDGVIELKLGHSVTTDNPRNVAANKFADLVKQKTNGKVEIKVFPNEVLGSEPQMMDAVKLGTLDFAMGDTAIYATLSPKMFTVNLPYMFKDYESAYKVLDGPLGKEMAEPLDSNNIHLLGYWENGFREATNSKHPINSPDDLAGLKMRVPETPISISTFKALGTNPTPMAYGQLYTSLQSKVVDGQENPLTNIYASKFYEVQKYLALTNHQYSAMAFVVSKKKWDSLSPDIQKAIQEASNEARDFHRQEVQKQAQELVKTLKDKGMEVTTPDSSLFRDKAKGVYQEFESKIGKDFLDKVMNQGK